MLTTDFLPGVPLIESPFFEHDIQSIPSEYRDVARALHDNGYAILDWPLERFGEQIEGIKRDFRNRYDWDAWRTGTLPSLRIADAWQDDPRVRSIATDPKILEMLSAIYGRQAFPFQTLNFAVGTQQAGHSDHAHFNSIPDRFMCGVWIAFEDVDEKNGPLFYYPGSHRWPSFQNEHLGVSYKEIREGFPAYSRYVQLWEALAAHEGLKKEIFKAKKGQALLWTSNIVHGGSKQLDLSRTRWSQVTHYLFHGCAYTTPVANDTFQGKLVFRDPIDITTGKQVNNIISGEMVRPAFREALVKLPEVMDEEALERTLSNSRFRNHPAIPADFDARAYLQKNPDVAAKNVDPFQHYVMFGKKEGRRWS
jgi:ectoine hydroxylase-related dioxygenase (phytanoyl-CoA dioxygenase family)